MILQEAEIRFNKARSDLSSCIKQMKIFGKAAGLGDEEIAEDIIIEVELEF